VNPLRILYVVLGFFFFGLGAFGAFVPILPTVPFLLLASFFFSKGSKRFERWFTSTKLYHDHLESYLRNRCMTRRTKIYIQTLATVMMTIAVIIVPVIPVKILIVALMLFMYYYFAFRIKTITREQEQVILSQEEALRTSAQAEEPIALRDTVHEIKVMHEEILEEASLRDSAKTETG
jgi:uncharacterized membrane protein YbaN (DUF454 family)